MGCLSSKTLKEPTVFQGLDETGASSPKAATSVDDVQVDLKDVIDKFESIIDIVHASNGGKLDGVLDLSQIGLEDAEDGYKPPIVKHELYLDEIPPEAFDCTGITTFLVKGHGNELSVIPAEIGSPSMAATLTTLNLSENTLTSLPEEIGELKLLTELDISENQLKSLPITIGQLVNLSTFSAFKNALSQLPSEIGDCVELEEVNCFNNKLIKLPPSFSGLSKLRDLNVGGNKLKTLPNVDQWTNLEELRAHQNTLVMIPSFAKLTSLTFLKLDFNKVLSSLPDIGTFLDKKLEHVECGNCDLAELPEALLKIQSLKVLQTQSNRIAALPEKVELPALDTLNVANNKLTALPEMGPATLPNLRVLFFNDNALDLAALPAGLGELTKLERVMCGDAAGEGEVLGQMRAVCEGNGGWVK